MNRAVPRLPGEPPEAAELTARHAAGLTFDEFAANIEKQDACVALATVVVAGCAPRQRDSAALALELAGHDGTTSSIAWEVHGDVRRLDATLDFSRQRRRSFQPHFADLTRAIARHALSQVGASPRPDSVGVTIATAWGIPPFRTTGTSGVVYAVEDL